MPNPILEKLIVRQNLTQNEILQAAQTLISEEQLYQLAAFLVLLRSKGETPEEIAAFISYLQKQALPFPEIGPVMDIVGTGGDGANTINISTGASILAAACGVTVAKHGNRAVSSKCGAADVLAALGVNLEIPPEKTADSIREIGIGFLFAQLYHPALKAISKVRRSLNVPTVFNLIAPLLNPAKPAYLLYGIYAEKFVPVMASVVQEIGVKHALVFHGNGTDELIPNGIIRALEVSHEMIKPLEIDPMKLGLKHCSIHDLRGGTPIENGKHLCDAFSGKEGPLADTLALNAGAALWIYGTVKNIEEGIEIAKSALKSGLAQKLLERWINYGQA